MWALIKIAPPAVDGNWPAAAAAAAVRPSFLAAWCEFIGKRRYNCDYDAMAVSRQQGHLDC